MGHSVHGKQFVGSLQDDLLCSHLGTAIRPVLAYVTRTVGTGIICMSHVSDKPAFWVGNFLFDDECMNTNAIQLCKSFGAPDQCHFNFSE